MGPGGRFPVRRIVRRVNLLACLVVLAMVVLGCSGVYSSQAFIEAWPNPARTRVTIRVSGNFGGAILSVRDVDGRPIIAFALPPGQFEWDLTNTNDDPVNSGLYLLAAVRGGQRISDPYRLVVQR